MLPQPITDVYPFQNLCAFNVDYGGQEYRVCWSGDWRRPPNLSSFPSLDGATATHIPHSFEVDKIWKASQVVRHGSDSHIREFNNSMDSFPVCKVAVDKRQRRLVQGEFMILHYFSTLHPKLPVVRISPEPLEDEQGVFGFKMERLCDIAHQNLGGHLDEIKAAIRMVHEAQIVHYDLSVSNIMLNMEGQITLIDFGRAGHIGDTIPLDKEKGVKPTGGQTYSISGDFRALQKIHDITETMKTGELA